jgi:hypothetical protein
MSSFRRIKRKFRLKIDDCRKPCGYRLPNRYEKKEFTDALCQGSIGTFYGFSESRPTNQKD